MDKLKKKTKKQPTELQERLALALIENEKREKPLNKTELLTSVGYTPLTAKSKQQEILTSEGLQIAFANNGIDSNRITKVLNEALEANQTSAFQGKIHKSDSPDHKIRMSALNLVGDFAGLKKLNVQQTNVNVNVEREDIEAILNNC